VTGLGLYVGLAVLVFSAFVYEPILERWLLKRFLQVPLFPIMNCLVPVLLSWLFYCLSGRAWGAYLGCALPAGAVALVNYYKVNLRGDPFLIGDLFQAAEAAGIAGGYDLTPGPPAVLLLLALLAGLPLAVLCLPRRAGDWGKRLFGAASCLALIAVALAGPYSSEEVYRRLDTTDIARQWSPAEVYLTKGCVYSFLHSDASLRPDPPGGYDREQASALLAQYPDSGIPEGKKVSVMGIMLEGFCDMTDFAPLAGQEAVARLYAPWHALEERSVHGNLLVNIFAGGTVDTEWSFLTGYTAHQDFHAPTQSYVWYFRDQGYQTFGSHPGHNWFYNRQNVNRNLGFQDYRFREEFFGEYLTEEQALRDSDRFLVQADADLLEERLAGGPCFSFSVTYQNHGPYADGAAEGTAWLSPGDLGLSDGARNILNNYFDGLSRTVQAMTELAGRLEALDEPVVLVLFGDHKPWAGNGESVYQELGVTFDLSTVGGLYERYATPYLIWANSAAKAALGRDFTGWGGDFSPCFLMAEVFDACGWEGPGFMKLSRRLRDLTPLVHSGGWFWQNDGLTGALEGDAQAFYQRFQQVQYYLEQDAD